MHSYNGSTRNALSEQKAVTNGSASKKYFTAEEAMAFMEPRIRSMFQ